jgi:hypothetical protein
MSKQSVAKEEQGYTRIPNTCGNCSSFTCDSEQSKWASGSVIERNLRCGIGGFKVNKTATCRKLVNKDRTMAAAPELLDALELANEELNAWRNNFPSYGYSEVVACMIDAAIAKAKGQ